MLVPCAPIARDAAALVQARILAERAAEQAADAHGDGHAEHGTQARGHAHAHGGTTPHGHGHGHGHGHEAAHAHAHAQATGGTSGHAHHATHAHDTSAPHPGHAAHAATPPSDGRASLVAPCPCGCDDAPPGASTGSRLPIATLPAALAAMPAGDHVADVAAAPAMPALAKAGIDPIPI